MVYITNLIAFILGTFWAIKAVRSILRGTKYSINFVMLVFYVFFILPLAFDSVLGVPKYTYELSFSIATADLYTNILYALYVSIVPVIWHMTAVRKTMGSGFKQGSSHLFSNYIYITMMVSPIFLLFFSPNPEIYLNYGAAILGFPSPEGEQFHSLISAATFFSVMSFSFLLIKQKELSLLFFMRFGPFLLATLWMNGKRNIVIWALVLVLYALWKRRTMQPKQILLMSLLFLTVGIGFSALYQQAFRYDDLKVDSWEDVYTNMRVDYGREDVTKMAIYAELNPSELTILDYRGQSMLYNLLFFVPREVWPGKPWPYAVYATSALIRIPPQYVGWGMTTGILDESIANFGLLGMLVGPLFISIVCRVGDRDQEPLPQLLTVLITILMLVLQLAAFMPVFLAWLAVVIWGNIKRIIAL